MGRAEGSVWGGVPLGYRCKKGLYFPTERKVEVFLLVFLLVLFFLNPSLAPFMCIAQRRTDNLVW